MTRHLDLLQKEQREMNGFQQKLQTVWPLNFILQRVYNIHNN